MEHTKIIKIDTKKIVIALIFFERSAKSAKNGCKTSAQIFAEARIYPASRFEYPHDKR